MGEVTRQYLMEEFGLTAEEAAIVGYEEEGSYISTPLTEVISNFGISSREYSLAVAGTISHALIAILNKERPHSVQVVKQIRG